MSTSPPAPAGDDAPPPGPDPAARARTATLWRWLAILLALAVGAAVIALVWPRGGPDGAPRVIYTGATPLPGRATTGVFITPMDGHGPLLDEIAAAREEITLHIYLVSDQQVIDALAAAARRGVHVRVLLEEHPYGGGGGQPEAFERLEQAGLDVRWSDPVFRFSHVKTFTMDRAVAVIMNMNLTWSAFTQNREVNVITNEPGIVRHALAVFEADWNRTSEPPDGPLIVSPDGARSDLLALIACAQRSLDIYAEVLRDDEFFRAIARAAERGVTVRIVMSPGDDRQLSTLRGLAERGVEVRLVSDVYIHAKVFLVDGERAFVGSQNMTSTSLDQNRELGAIVEDPGAVERIGRVFDLDFRLGREVTP
ncbi:MAG: phospholipase D-like domain-containing protein [Chloroflexota bacterium]